MTITGSGFTGTAAVTFGGTAATSFTVNSDTSITAVTPGGPAGAVDVAVARPDGSASLPNGFTYTAVAPPVITSVAPNTGPEAGGTSVTITGTGFTGATAVTFGGTAAASFTVVSDTSITATTPAHAAGAVDVAVARPDGSASLPNGFTYTVVPPPVITSVAPTTGPTAGGTSVTITGTGFTGATVVTFGGPAATNITVVNDTTITAIDAGACGRGGRRRGGQAGPKRQPGERFHLPGAASRRSPRSRRTAAPRRAARR